MPFPLGVGVHVGSRTAAPRGFPSSHPTVQTCVELLLVVGGLVVVVVLVVSSGAAAPPLVQTPHRKCAPLLGRLRRAPPLVGAPPETPDSYFAQRCCRQHRPPDVGAPPLVQLRLQRDAPPLVVLRLLGLLALRGQALQDLGTALALVLADRSPPFRRWPPRARAPPVLLVGRVGWLPSRRRLGG